MSCMAVISPLSPTTYADPLGRCSSRKSAVASAEVKIRSSGTSIPLPSSRARRSRRVKIELLVISRYFRPLAFRASMNSAAPGIGSSSCTSTPSMSVSQVWTGRDSLMPPSFRTASVAGRRARRRLRPSSPEVDDGGDGATAVRTLGGCGDGYQNRGVAGHRGGDAAAGRLDLAVPVDVRVVQHRVPAAADEAVLGCLALEENVDQPAVEVLGARALREVEPGGADRVPDAVGVERVLHHRVADPVAAADAGRVADHDHLGAVELDPRGA